MSEAAPSTSDTCAYARSRHFTDCNQLPEAPNDQIPFFPCLYNLPGGEGMAGVEGTGICVGNGSTIYEVLKTD